VSATLHEHVAVDISSVAGQGVLAAARIAAGTVVVTFDAPVSTVTDFGSLNHSCDPDLGWDGATTLVALRDVAAGEELTADYSTAITDREFVLRCHCPSSRCRQMVTGDDWQIRQLQQRYAGHWHPDVQRRIDEAPPAA
jgi:hypothetical protein